MAAQSVAVPEQEVKPDGWRPLALEVYAARYEAHPDGKIRNAVTGLVLRPGRTSRGYVTVNLYDGSGPKRSRSITVHSLIAAVFIGPRPPGQTVNHKDLDKTNNALANLEYMTQLDNQRHAIANGRGPARYCGEASCRSVLTEAKAREAIILFAQGWGDQAVADRMGVSAPCVWMIRNGRTWKHLPRPWTEIPKLKRGPQPKRTAEESAA